MPLRDKDPSPGPFLSIWNNDPLKYSPDPYFIFRNNAPPFFFFFLNKAPYGFF